MNKTYLHIISNPLKSLLIGAFLIRLISVIFSKGYGMQDDHFLVIEAAQSFIDSINHNNWLPSETNQTPSGHSWFYVGLHYLFFLFCKVIHLDDPQIKMFIIRLAHALFSLLTVYWGYKLTERIASAKLAIQVGLLLAFSWYMPFLSVRNLVEIVCIPFMLGGIWYLIKHPVKPTWQQVVLSGILVGLGFSVRFQTAFFILGIGIALLLLKRWRDTFLFSAATIFAIVIIQGGIDYFIWGKPFVEFTEYVRYNLENKYEYFTAPWYVYLLLLAGIFVPPVSLFLLWGFIRMYKKQLLIFLPTLLFLLFHMYFPNKQERFILPIVPFIIILGVCGWYAFYERSTFWQSHPRLHRGSWIFFWVISTLVLPIISTSYSKRSQVEAMTYLSRYKNISSLIVEDRNHGSVKIIPLFYLNQWPYYYPVDGSTNMQDLKQTFINLKELKMPQPQYILFCDSLNLKQRVAAMDSILPALRYETTIAPSFIDNLMRQLNHHNKNQTIYIYSVK